MGGLSRFRSRVALFAIQTAITATENAEVKKRLQAQNKALLDETKLLKQAALDKDAISKGGASVRDQAKKMRDNTIEPVDTFAGLS